MINTENVQIGEQIRYYRTRIGMSQETLALTANVNPVYVGQIERGLKSPTVNMLKKLSDALGISLAALFNPIPENATNPSEKRNFEIEKIMLSINRLSDDELTILSQIVANIVDFKKSP